MYEVVATLRVARDEHGIYMGVLDFGDGAAPESLEGYDTLDALFTRASRMVAATLAENEDEAS